MDCQIHFKGEEICFSFTYGNAIATILTNEIYLKNCMLLLADVRRRAADTILGDFGIYPVTLNIDAEDRASIFVDGPIFTPQMVQSWAVSVDKQVLRKEIENLYTKIVKRNR